MWTLVSEPRIDADGGSMSCKGGVRRMFNSSGDLIISANLSNHTYLLDDNCTPMSYESTTSSVADARCLNEADMWHCRLGHLNFQDMGKLK